MVAIQRHDTKEWAIPGGMVDAGERTSDTVKREFMEEATSQERASAKDIERNEKLLDQLFDNGRVVYRGYVDDPRNTDHAWMETTAFHFHCNAECARMLKLEAGDDARSVGWIDVDPTSDTYTTLYASHREWVDQCAQRMLPHRRARSSAESANYGYPPRYEVEDEHVMWEVPLPDYAPRTHTPSAPPKPPSDRLLSRGDSRHFATFGKMLGRRGDDELAPIPDPALAVATNKPTRFEAFKSRRSSAAHRRSTNDRRSTHEPTDKPHVLERSKSADSCTSTTTRLLAAHAAHAAHATHATHATHAAY
jgi:ADP-ribose pyrophosphatase YjhB (NUDIX family)